MNRFVPILAGVCLLFPLLTLAQEAREVPFRGRYSDALMGHLDELMDMKDFQQPVRLREVLGLFYEKFAAQGKELSILVDTAAFTDQNPKVVVTDTEIAFPPYPRKMTLATALRIALSNVPDRNATYLLRKDHIEITTKERAKLSNLLKQPVAARFHKVPLAEALEQLAEEYAVSINWDPKASEKAGPQNVTATFRHDVDLENAVRTLTEMGGVKIVRFPSGLYVTTPEAAAALERELRQREQPAPVKKE